MRKSAILLLMSLLTYSSTAQTIVEVNADTTAFLIGEQVRLRLSVKTDRQRRVQFPEYVSGEEMTPGVEVVANSSVDTTLQDAGKRMELVRHYTVTSFDSALYYILPHVLIDGDTVQARTAVGLKVETVDVDTIHIDQYTDPHGVVEETFIWRSYLLWLSLSLWLTLGLLVIVCIRLSSTRPITKRIFVPPTIAPHKQAIAEMQTIRTLPMDNPVQVKEYYTRLTDILRQYIQRRFSISAMEMTSEDIVNKLLQGEEPHTINELQEVFMTADLVKFAKYESTFMEKDRNLLQAIHFIQDTKSEEAMPEKPTVEVVSLSDQHQMRWRRWLTITAIFLGFAVLAQVAYLVWAVVTIFL